MAFIWGCDRDDKPGSPEHTSSDDTTVSSTKSPAMQNITKNCSYLLEPQPSEKYPDVSGRALIDGKYASKKNLHHDWLGFDKSKPTITVDLQKAYKIGRVKASFLSYPEFGINLPKSMTISVSLDGARWVKSGQVGSAEAEFSTFDLNITAAAGRYVRLEMERNMWTFIDEIEIFGSTDSCYQAIKEIMLITAGGAEYDESIARITNLIEGMGLPFDVIAQDSIVKTDLNNYQLVILAGSSMKEFVMNEADEGRIIEAIRQGVDCLWIGRGLWGSFRSTNLADAFGLRYIKQDLSTKMGITKASFTNLAGDTDRLKVHKETVYWVEPGKAGVEGWYLDVNGKELDIPFITRYRANKHSGNAVYVSLPLLDSWKSTEAADTYARAEVLFKYIRKLTRDGIIGKHPVRSAKDAVFMLRLEDYTPGGYEMGHTERLWMIRMERLLELTREHDLPLNIALVPKYAHPFNDEFYDWDTQEPNIVTLRRQAQQAFNNGGSMIVHGYKHQNGEEPDDFSGDDWEMWDEDAEHFLTLNEQKQITNNAFAEVAEKWGIKPTTWETPHYIGNADTFQAAYESGFLYFTESDTKLFPNRQGYLNYAQGLLLNIPETASYYPDDANKIKVTSLIKGNYILPRLVRLNGLFYVFYHNNSVCQQKALENTLVTATLFNFWKPSLEEYAKFWLDRELVEIRSQVDHVHEKFMVNVDNSFEGLTLSVRLPDNSVPGDIQIDDKTVEVLSRQIAGAWYVYPVLADAQKCRVVIDFKKEQPVARPKLTEMWSPVGVAFE